jgi:hypothetical protein
MHEELLKLKTVKTKFFVKMRFETEKFQKELRAPIKTRARELQNH